MGWVENLRGQVVGLDTAPLIYYVERNSAYRDMLRLFFQAVDRGEFALITSVVTLLEVLVHPVRIGNKKLVGQYRDILFNSQGLSTVVLSSAIAEEAARLRAFHKLHTPDAIQMATAINASASYFLTNDIHLPSLPHLKMLRLDDLRKS